MPVSIAFIKELETIDPKFRRVLLSMLEELERQREESVTKKEFNELKEIVRKLGKSINELAEAQKRTEERLEGLSDTIGYSLENRAYKALPKILATYGLKVEGRLLRRYVKVDNKERQLNIYGYARRNGKRLLVLGETKVRPSKKEFARFEKLCKKLEKQEGLPVFKIFVAHDFPPAIEKELSEKEILPIWSYDLE